MGYKVKVGLEMHCEASETNTKVFSSARNSYSVTPNENIRPVDDKYLPLYDILDSYILRQTLQDN